MAHYKQYTEEDLNGLVKGGYYPPAIHYTVTYFTPVKFEVLELHVKGTNKPQVTFPIEVYHADGEFMCFISQVCVASLPSPVTLLHSSFVTYNVR